MYLGSSVHAAESREIFVHVGLRVRRVHAHLSSSIVICRHLSSSIVICRDLFIPRSHIVALWGA